MAKNLLDFKTPTGASGNLLSPASWLQLILGTMVLLITFAVGQNFTRKIGTKLPIDTEIDPLVKAAVTSSNAPAKTVY